VLAICFTNDANGEELSETGAGPGWGRGRITIDDFVEDFESPLWFWKTADYERQWAEGIQRILEGAPKSCLITSLIEPIRTADYVFGSWWKLYLNGINVIVQQQLLIGDVVGTVFDVADPYSAVPDYRPTTAEGEPLSSWTTSLRELKLPFSPLTDSQS
jgi:hypothetical protein